MTEEIISSTTLKTVRTQSRCYFIIAIVFFLAALTVFLYDRFAIDALNVSIYLHAIGSVSYVCYYFRFKCPNCKLSLDGIWKNAGCGCCGHT